MFSRLSIRQIAWAVGLGVALIYGLTLVLLSPPALQDFPAHLARAAAMGSLIFHDGAQFRGMFHYHFLFTPYVLGDLGLTSFVELFGARLGGGLWTAVVVASLPAALLFYLHVLGASAEDRLLIFILSLYLATDWFFVMGFLSFRLCVALTIVTLGVLKLLRARWSARLYLLYTALVAISYLTHLAGLAFLTVAVVMISALELRSGSTSMEREALLFAPLAVLLVWHFGITGGYDRPGDPIENPYTWGTVHEKIIRLSSGFLRFDRLRDLMLAELLAVCVLIRIEGARLRDLSIPSVREMLVLAAAFLAMYVALPTRYSEAWAVDVRPLALVSVFLVLASAGLPIRRTWRGPRGVAVAVVLALTLAISNLTYLGRQLQRDQLWLSQYRAIVARLPEGARVLPVYTLSLEGVVSPFMHANAFITIDRGGLIPYDFTGDTANPQKYFRYVHRPYRPDELWYLEGSQDHVDWSQVMRDYDYLLVTRPYDIAQIKVSARVLAENEVATLLAISRTPEAARR
jgi:hypothetical protein